MLIEEYLKQYQPVAYRVFKKSLSEGKLNHAYLLAGENGVPLKEIALFLAKSIVCDFPTPFACEECLLCHRINEGTYTDLILLDGEEETIKKGDVVEITSSFSKTSMESKGVMIYIINLAERMTLEAVNSLLKFLEEPSPNTYAILTSRNSARILPTILSRCEVIRLNAMAKDKVLEGCKALKVPENVSEVLSFFYGAPELVSERVEEEETEETIETLKNIAKVLSMDDFVSLSKFQTKITLLNSSRAKASRVIDLLTIIFKEALNIKRGFLLELPSYYSLLEPIANKFSLKILERNLNFLLGVRSELDLNINPSLLLDHIVINLFKEETI